MTISAYPLQWPVGWPRLHWSDRKFGRFGVRKQSSFGSWKTLDGITVHEATKRVLQELESMGIDRQDVVVSTNVKLRLDGLPRSGERAPDDPGAAVYWVTAYDERRVMAIDRYKTVADNLAAIAATLNAMRAIERHGGAQILDRAFTGFAALAAPDAPREWWEVLGVGKNCTREEAKAAYRALASKHHPDKEGGDNGRMAEINTAFETALKEVFQ